jgi:hypothetical protein
MKTKPNPVPFLWFTALFRISTLVATLVLSAQRRYNLQTILPIFFISLIFNHHATNCSHNNTKTAIYNVLLWVQFFVLPRTDLVLVEYYIYNIFCVDVFFNIGVVPIVILLIMWFCFRCLSAACWSNIFTAIAFSVTPTQLCAVQIVLFTFAVTTANLLAWTFNELRTVFGYVRKCWPFRSVSLLSFPIPNHRD